MLVNETYFSVLSNVTEFVCWQNTSFVTRSAGPTNKSKSRSTNKSTSNFEGNKQLNGRLNKKMGQIPFKNIDTNDAALCPVHASSSTKGQPEKERRCCLNDHNPIFNCPASQRIPLTFNFLNHSMCLFFATRGYPSSQKNHLTSATTEEGSPHVHLC